MIPIAMPQIMPAMTITTAARKLSMEAVISIPRCARVVRVVRETRAVQDAATKNPPG
jgi:hypothetical protein